MFAPILEAAQEWVAPGVDQENLSRSHFARRCADRGVASLPGWVVHWMVLEALARGREDLLEPVYNLSKGAVLYRVLLPDGPFFPVVRDGVPVTIYSVTEKRDLRFIRRRRKRRKGTRLARDPHP